MKPPYYYSLFAENGQECSLRSKLHTISLLSTEDQQRWKDWLKDNPNDEKAQFVMRNLL